jgi:tetratricopeptide (TPR) repeat protein
MKRLARVALVFLLVGNSIVGIAQELAKKGIEAYKTHDFTRAQEIFAVLVKREPSAKNFNWLALSESAGGKHDWAVANFQRSIRLGNNSANVHYDLGLSYLQLKKPALGTREIQIALSLNPKLESARYTLAVVLLDAGRSQEALQQLLRLREESPCDDAIWANLVRAQFDVGNTEAALRTIDKATRGMAHNVALIVTMAALCERYHQPQKARYLLEGANELRPDDPDIKLLLAKASLEAQEPVEALAILKDVPVSYGKPGMISFTRGLALALTGQEEQAEKELSEAVEASPGSVRYLVALAWAYQLENRQDEALKTLGKAREEDPQSAVVPFRMAISSFFLHHYDQAIQSCVEAIQLYPRYHAAYLLLGVAHLERGDLDGAETAIQQAIKLAPTTALYHRELGVIFFKSERLVESQRELDQAITLNPKAAQAYYWRARSLVGLGAEQAAIGDLETTVALQPDNRDAYSELARLYARTGQPQKAADAQAKEKTIEAASGSEYRHDFLSDLADPLL